MSSEKSPEAVGCDASIMKNVWEIRTREYGQKMRLEQERLEKSALPTWEICFCWYLHPSFKRQLLLNHLLTDFYTDYAQIIALDLWLQTRNWNQTGKICACIYCSSEQTAQKVPPSAVSQHDIHTFTQTALTFALISELRGWSFILHTLSYRTISDKNCSRLSFGMDMTTRFDMCSIYKQLNLTFLVFSDRQLLVFLLNWRLWKCKQQQVFAKVLLVSF